LKRMAWIHFTRARKDSNLVALPPDGSRIYVAGTDRKTAKAFVSEFHFFFGSGQSHTGLRQDFDLAGGAVSALGTTPDSRFVLDRANNNQVSSQNIGAVIIPRNLALGSNAGGNFGLLTTNQSLVLLSASGLPARIASNSSLFPGNFSPDKVAITPDGNVAYLTDGAQPSAARLDVSGRGGFGRAQILK